VEKAVENTLFIPEKHNASNDFVTDCTWLQQSLGGAF
jgi:hypothetical protein